MKYLEDKIKERLEGYESKLPEGDFAEFKDLLNESVSVGKKRTPSYLIWFAPVALVAGLAIFFVLGRDLHQDNAQEGKSSILLADVVEVPLTDVNEMAEPEPREDKIKVQTMTLSESERSVSKQIQANHSGDNKQDRKCEQGEKEQSPFVPLGSNIRKPVDMKVGQAAAGVLGGTGVLALASFLSNNIKTNNEGKNLPDTNYPSGPFDPVEDNRTMEDVHYLPFRSGISFCMAFSDKWSLITGIDYSLYVSSLEYQLSGRHKQVVHYLGIPLRVDLTIAKNKWIDVYVGTGGSVEFCVAAYNAGKKVDRDGVACSLTGACGIQFNLFPQTAFFMESSASYRLPFTEPVLDSYKSSNPLMQSFSMGLRFTITNKQLK